jgi:glutamate synthase domain-containing protein 2
MNFMLVRHLFYLFIALSAALLALLAHYHIYSLTLAAIIALSILIGLFDLCSHQNVRRNFPVIGHIRYMFEFIRPEIQQYFVATNLSGRPFCREVRALVYRRGKNVDDTIPFGTERDIMDAAYSYAKHSLKPAAKMHPDLRITIGAKQCKRPYQASILNISAMSYGSLGRNAIRALNLGAKKGNFAHNTGEGGLSPYHLEHGGDLIWQIGTGYFSCRTTQGQFDSKKFAQKAKHPNIKMIEIKISQGAKPSHGGILPKEKITKEISQIRGVPQGQDCISPPHHTTFDDPLSLLEFIAQLRKLSHSKPVGIKLCVGYQHQFMALCHAMLQKKQYPDFITIDGAEGGTGAAPVEFTNRLGMPIDEAIAFVHNCLVGCGIRDKITLIASGKVATAFEIIKKLALGADACNAARPMMFAVGCIQALKCNTNECPTGVATTDPGRNKGLVVTTKAKHVQSFHQ